MGQFALSVNSLLLCCCKKIDRISGKEDVTSVPCELEDMLDLCEVYKERCAFHQCKANSAVLRTLTSSNCAASSSELVVDLSRNIIGLRGLLPLLDVVLACSRADSAADSTLPLVALRLRENFLTNDAVILICDSLEGCATLRELDISNNAISMPSGKRLIQFLNRTPSVTNVLLEGTLVSPGLKRRIQSMLAARQRTKEARASGMPLVTPPKELAALHKAFERVRDEVLRTEPTAFSTRTFQALAILFSSSRHAIAHPPSSQKRLSQGDAVIDLSPTPGDMIALPDGSVARASVVIDIAELPAGTIGDYLLSQRRGSVRSRSVGGVASPFSLLPVLLTLPRRLAVPAVELLLDCAFDAIVPLVPGSSPFPALSSLRVSHPADLRDSSRAALNLLLNCAFSDPMPPFADMLQPSPSDGVPDPVGRPDTVDPDPPCEAKGCVEAVAPEASENGELRENSVTMTTTLTVTDIPTDWMPGLVRATDDVPAPFSLGSGVGASASQPATSTSTRDEIIQRVVHSAPFGALVALLDVSTPDMTGMLQLRDAYATHCCR